MIFQNIFPDKCISRHLEMLRYKKYHIMKIKIIWLVYLEFFIFKIISDYITIIHNKKNFEANVDFYKIYKKYITLLSQKMSVY